MTRLASKGVKVDDGDGGTKVVKFADAEDAYVYLERSIARGEIDGEDIFDDEGRIQLDEVSSALAELLERKPHYAEQATDAPPAKKNHGSADAGKGRGSGRRSLEEMTPEEHLAAVRAR